MRARTPTRRNARSGAPNNETILTRERYTARHNAQSGAESARIDAVRRHAPGAEVVDR
jgi:uncharacterized protein YegP (UPF0339 family)